VVGVHLGGARDDVVATLLAAGKRVVGLGERPDAIVTADGVVENGFVRPLKEEVDEAVPDAARVIVLRLLGDVPLGPTYDVYLEVAMRPGRDFWCED
jgi:hypothetical protein